MLLREDAGFSKAFARYLPFNPEMGWYPYVRVTGFFSSAKASTEGLSSLSMSLVEFREPKKYLEVRADLVELGSGELRHPIYLDRWSDLVLFLYLLPIVTAGSNLASSDISPELAAILRAYAGKIASDVPHALAKFYGSLPLPQDA